MNNNQEFDRLAKQKMNERNFPFEEAHWLEAKKMIAGKNRNRGYLHLLWLLLPATVMCVWLIAGNDEQTQSSLIQPATVQPEVTATSHVYASATSSENNNSTDNNNENGVDEINQPASNGENEKSLIEGINSIENKNSSGKTSKPRNENNDVSLGTGVIVKGENIKNGKRIFEKSNDAQPISNLIIPYSNTANGEASATSPSTDPNIIAMVSNPEEPMVQHENNKIKAGSEMEMSAEVKQRQQATRINSINGIFEESELQLDAARSMHVPSVSWWKLSLLGSFWNNSTQIGGLVPETWMDHVEGARTAGFGVEVMRSYRHFGWGTGVHYTSYGEFAEVDPEFITLSESFKYWYLTPVDTTVWIITDSVFNGESYTYLGYSESRTINTIESAYDTITTTEKLRDARRIQNRVSYFEIPLIADIHAGKGRWVFGLKGGPTIGKLVERNGALPNPDGSGYNELSSVGFQQWIPGYNIRAYVDYKIGMRWSLGVQGGKRGFFGNTLSGGPYTRNTDAWGGMISLSYMLRHER
jgi:hypothetical protein